MKGERKVEVRKCFVCVSDGRGVHKRWVMREGITGNEERRVCGYVDGEECGAKYIGRPGSRWR